MDQFARSESAAMPDVPQRMAVQKQLIRICFTIYLSGRRPPEIMHNAACQIIGFLQIKPLLEITLTPNDNLKC
jgi:hypothetical protein